MKVETVFGRRPGWVALWLVMALMLTVLLRPAAAEDAPAVAAAPVEAAAPSEMTASAAPEPVARVVYHADFADPRRFSAMLTSINNMVNYYQQNLMEYDVRIVFVAHGIRFVTADPLKGTPFAEDKELRARRRDLANRLASLHDVQNVKLELCGITREQVGLDPARLTAGVELVPSGVVRIAELQHQGYAYIKIE